MGTAQSSPSSPISVQSGTPDPNFDKVTSGIRITTGTAEQKVDTNINFKAAYDKGHEDGVNTFQSSLEQVAAQVYDGVHKQLADIQTESLAKSKELVSVPFVYSQICNVFMVFTPFANHIFLGGRSAEEAHSTW